jgi:hypothetical protein
MTKQKARLSSKILSPAALDWGRVDGSTNPDFYLGLLPRIVETARLHGYAIGVHGSLNRDLDVIAVAWVGGASDPAELAAAIANTLPGVFTQHGANEGVPEKKPHGRLAWAIQVGQGRYVDLSVIGPREE